MTKGLKPIIIFGGTFDPVHNGHLYIAKECLAKLQIDHIRFIPCQQNVLKHNEPKASSDDRLNMLRLALADRPSFVIDEREIERNSPSYMIDTLKSLQAEFDQPLYLLMSEDTFAKFDQWQDYQEILLLANLIVVPRPGFNQQLSPAMNKLVGKHKVNQPQALQPASHGQILLLSLPNGLKIAATDIRNVIFQGDDASQMLPQAVWQYICDHKLYSKFAIR